MSTYYGKNNLDKNFQNVELLLTMEGEENSTRIIDSSKNNFTVSVFGNAKISTSQKLPGTRSSCFFDGSGDYLSIDSNVAFNLGTDDFTIECYINVTAFPLVGNKVFISNVDGGTNNNYFYSGVTPSGYISYVIRDDLGSDSYIGKTLLVTDQWYHVAIVRRNNLIFGYINGKQDLVKTSTKSITQRPIIIGASRYTSALTYFHGHISNVKIIKGLARYTSDFIPSTEPLRYVEGTSLLTAQENLIYDRGTNFPITIAGNTVASTFSPNNDKYSIYFEDSATGGITIASNTEFNFNTGNFTVEGWFYPTRANDASSPINIAWAIGTINGANFASGGVSTTTIFYRAGGSGNQIAASASISNTWNHIAWVRISGTVYIYLNGKMFISAADTTSISSTGDVIISRPDSSTYRFGGYISNLRIIKNVGLYNTNFIPSLYPLISIENTVLLIGQNSSFVDNSSNDFALSVNGNTTINELHPFLNKSLSFSNSSLATTNTDQFSPSAEFTIEFWMYIQSLSSVNAIVGNYTANNSTDWLIEVNTNGALRIYVNGSSVRITSTSLIQLHNWYHVALVRNSSNLISLYINGQLTGTPYTFSGTFGTPSKIIYIGIQGGLVNSLNGYLSNLLMVEGTALYSTNFEPSTDVVSNLPGTKLLICKNNSFERYSYNPDNTTITVSSNALLLPVSPITQVNKNSSVYFESDDYIRVGAAANWRFLHDYTTKYTIEFWLNVRVFESPSYLISTAGGSFVNYFTLFAESDGKLYLSVKNATGSDIFNLSGVKVLTNNVWYHIAITVDPTLGTNNGNIYIDGVLDISGTKISNTPSTTDPQNALTIGGFQNITSFGCNAYISNLRIVKDVIYTSNFNPPIRPLSLIDNTFLLTCQGIGFKDYSENNFNVISPSNAKHTYNSPFEEKYTLKNSYYFDGSGDYLTIPYSANLDITQGDFTLELWVFALQNDGVLMTQRPSSGNFGWNLKISSGNLIQFWYTGGSVYSTTAISLLKWNHLVIIKKDSNLTMFLNGEQNQLYSISNGTSVSSGTNLYLGTNELTSGQFFKGYMSNIRIVNGRNLYNLDFTPTQSIQFSNNKFKKIDKFFENVEILIQSSKITSPTDFIDNSKNNVTVTNNNSVSISGAQTLFANYNSINFNGSNYLSLAGNARYTLSSYNFTIECWVFTTTLSTTQSLISSNQSGGMFDLSIGTNGRITFSINTNNGSTNTYSSVTGTTTLVTINNWHHIAIVRNNSAVTIFLNGQNDSTTLNIGTSIVGSFGGVKSIYIGAGVDAANKLTGYMDNIRYSVGIARYKEKFLVPTRNF